MQTGESPSVNDRTAVEYAAAHELHELVDMLITEVAAHQPKNPVAHMADFLQKRIAKREKRHDDTLLAATLTSTTWNAEMKVASRAQVDGANRLSDGNSQCLVRFGIWFHICYADLPSIVESFGKSMKKHFPHADEAPPDFATNVEFLLQMLATASATEHYKGFDEAIKFVPLRPHQQTPQACALLIQCVLDAAPAATPTQRRSFIAFMRRVGFYLRLASSLDDGAVVKTAWRAIRDDRRCWDAICAYVRREHRHMDPIAAMEADFFIVHANIIDNAVALLPKIHQLRKEVIEPAYEKILKIPGRQLVPDRFVMFSALFYRAIEECVDREVFDPITAQLFEDLLLRLIEIVNEVACDHFSDVRRLCVRLGSPSLFRTMKRFIGNDSYRVRSESEEGRTLYCKYLEGFQGYTPDGPASFMAVARAVLDTPRMFYSSEGYAIRCNAEAHRTLLHMLSALVHFRDTITVGEVQLLIVRSRCFGVSPYNLFVYFAEEFGKIATVSFQTRETAKQMLIVLQEVCLAALNSPIMEELARSLQVFADAIEPKHLSEHMMVTSMSQEVLTPEALGNYLGVDVFLRELIQAFGTPIDQTPGHVQDRFFSSYSLMTARLQVSRIQMSGCCDFVAMALLSSADDIAANASVHPLLPAMEVFFGLSHALDLATYAKSSAYDRMKLLRHFQSRKTSRLLMLAIEDFVRTFPVYHARLTRPSISLESLQLPFVGLLMKLLEAPLVASMSKELREVAVTLAVRGVLPQDYDLFGICMERVLRSPDFPEAEWGGFYREVVDALIELSPPVRSVRTYGIDDIVNIVRAQAYTRRYVVRRRLRIAQQSKVFQLERLFQLSRDSAKGSTVENDDDLFNLDTNKARMRDLDRQVVQLSWSTLDLDTQALLIYHALQSAPTFKGTREEMDQLYNGNHSLSNVFSAPASPHNDDPGLGTDASVVGSSSTSGSKAPLTVSHSVLKEVRAQKMETLENCRTIATHFSTIVNVMTPTLSASPPPRASGLIEEEGWVVVLRELYDGSMAVFFDHQLAMEHLLPFGTLLVDGVCRKLPLSHPGIRVAWVAFMGDLGNIMT